jgi:predicted TIM-barrel fold metal-dependent hydrolase
MRRGEQEVGVTKPKRPFRGRRFAALMAAVVLLVFLFAAFLACCRKDRPRGPAIDSHTLIVPLDESIDAVLKLFERIGVVKFCNKNGGYLGSKLFAATVQVKHRLKDKFEFFANVSWLGVNDPGRGEYEAGRFEKEVGFGAKGVKFFKAMGLGARDAAGRLIPMDDARFDPIVERAARLNAVVAIHVGDPKAFFEPPTPKNERYDELRLAPDWSFFGGDYPMLAQLWEQTERLIGRHPDTTFLLIHLGMAEDIGFMERFLDSHPNVHLDTAARVPEFGRHPVDKLRRFFAKFQDRVLFGTDISIGPDHWQLGSVSEKPVGFEDAVKF